MKEKVIKNGLLVTLRRYGIRVFHHQIEFFILSEDEGSSNKKRACTQTRSSVTQNLKFTKTVDKNFVIHPI